MILAPPHKWMESNADGKASLAIHECSCWPLSFLLAGIASLFDFTAIALDFVVYVMTHFKLSSVLIILGA